MQCRIIAELTADIHLHIHLQDVDIGMNLKTLTPVQSECTGEDMKDMDKSLHTSFFS